MAIPGFQEMMLPLLRLVADKQEHAIRNLTMQVADQFKLDDADRAELLSSGVRTVVNRVAWARIYLVKAGLLASTRRGFVRITESGCKLLEQQPLSLNVSYLKQHYPQISEFTDGTLGHQAKSQDVEQDSTDETPEETLERAYRRLRQELVEEILGQLKEMSPQAFERLVVELLVKMGYGGTLTDAGRAIGQSGDGGIDGIIKEDRLGLDTIYLQAKRYGEQSIGRPMIQAFVGALQGVRARKGIFITTSKFASSAVQYVGSIETKVVLIDGQQLAEYMVDFDLGVTRVNTFELKRIDTDYFEQV